MQTPELGTLKKNGDHFMLKGKLRRLKKEVEEQL